MDGRDKHDHDGFNVWQSLKRGVDRGEIVFGRHRIQAARASVLHRIRLPTLLVFLHLVGILIYDDSNIVFY